VALGLVCRRPRRLRDGIARRLEEIVREIRALKPAAKLLADDDDMIPVGAVAGMCR